MQRKAWVRFGVALIVAPLILALSLSGAAFAFAALSDPIAQAASLGVEALMVFAAAFLVVSVVVGGVLGAALLSLRVVGTGAWAATGLVAGIGAALAHGLMVTGQPDIVHILAGGALAMLLFVLIRWVGNVAEAHNQPKGPDGEELPEPSWAQES